MKKIIILLILLLIPFAVNAKEITKDCIIKLDNNAISSSLVDNVEKTYVQILKNQVITIESKSNIKGLYLIYELDGGEGIISNGKETTSFGTNRFIHDYVDVSELLGDSNKITIKYNEDTWLTDIYVIGDGDIPSFVEVWNAPVEKADLLLFTTHSDDEQLFFAGLLPHYVAKGANVQVVYFTKHRNGIIRFHELLHGLYTVGIRNYPIIGKILDKYAETLKQALYNLKESGLSEKDVIDFQVEMIRRFKPLVIVTHDEKGEYGHGQHIMCTYYLERAIDYANDKTYDESTYNKYGTWSTKKVYIHLYSKNKIVMDYDTPLDYFDGKTAFQMSQLGFEKHISQHNTWFKTWLDGEEGEITKASQIQTYSPREYGLFRSLVGPDVEKNDMFENLSFYKDISDMDEFLNKEVQQTIKEEPMKNNDSSISLKQILLYVVVLCTGIGILVLIRKL